MKCVIPCAGESSRMSFVPKHMIRIRGEPLLCHVVNRWKDVVDSFVFVLSRSMTYMWEYLPEKSIVVFQDEPKGLADAILRAEPCIKGRFVVALGDCLFRGMFDEVGCELGVGVWTTEFPGTELSKNFLVINYGNRITRLKEKPSEMAAGGRCGMGVYFLDDRVFNYIRQAKVRPGGGDFTEVLQMMVDAGLTILPVWFRGYYVNITSPEDIAEAEKMLARQD